MIGQLLLAGSEALQPCDSAQFDGTNDYMTRGAGLTGAADSKTGIISYWVRFDGGDGVIMFILCNSNSVGGAVAGNRFTKGAANLIEIICGDTTDTFNLLLRTTATFTANASWVHVLSSWDLLNNVSSLYVNDVLDQTVTTRTNSTIDYTKADWSVGGVPSGGLNKLNGCLAELYFAPGQYLDFSVTANRRKFISAGGKPVYFGADGSLPTGTAPIVYQQLAHSAAASTFANNLGTGGNFTITGTLTTGSTSPSS